MRGTTPNKLEPQDAATPAGMDGAVSEETMRRLGEAAGVSVWTWRVDDDVVHHMGGSRRPGRTTAPLDSMLEQVDPVDRPRVRRRLKAAARSGSSGTMQLRSAPGSGSRILSSQHGRRMP